MRQPIARSHPLPPWTWSLLPLLALAILLVPALAEADTAAGTVLTNSVTVNFDDEGGTAQTAVSDSVDVTVSLVGAVEWGTAPGGQITGSGGALPAAYTFTLRNTGNGSDTFTLTDGTTQSSGNLSASTIAITAPADEDGGTGGHQIILFGTISSGAGVFAAGETTIPVGNLTVGDLVPGTTTVRIGAGTYTVAAGSTATSLVVSGDASTDAGAAGVQIGEIVTVTYNGNAGTLSGGATSETHNHSLTATGLSQGGNAAASATINGWTTTVQGAVLAVTKYVRNVLNANGNTGGVGATPVNGTTYYTSGVTGNSGDTLEYAIVIANTGGGNATDVVMEDTLPAYTSYVANSIQVDTDGIGGYDVTLPGPDTEGHDEAGGIVETDTGVAATTTKIKVYAGTGGDETASGGYAGTGGTVAGGGNTVVLYRITIN